MLDILRVVMMGISWSFMSINIPVQSFGGAMGLYEDTVDVLGSIVQGYERLNGLYVIVFLVYGGTAHESKFESATCLEG